MLGSIFLLLLSQADAPQSPPTEIVSADFRIDFADAGRPIPAGIGRGINDLSNASAGVWQAWSDAIQPHDGLARIWIDYSKGPMAKQTAAGLRARDAGMNVFLVVVGDPAHKGIGHEQVGKAPLDPAAWAERVAADVRTLLSAGVPLTHVEIWNEPNFAGQWDGGAESFGQFFALAGKRLRELFPKLELGGPGMASASGAAYDWFAAMAGASKEVGFTPDFLSWHFYSSYPGDLESCRFGERIAATAISAGLRKPELILSEWNIDLPHPTAPECDDHRAAAFFVGVNSFLAQTEASHSLFFFLQDGFWEATKDYAGESVGVYTLHGGPKAVLNGMRMFRTASSLPMVAVERNAPWNISCLATRSEDCGYLLLSNSFGQAEKRARHYVDANGVDLGVYRGKDVLLRAFLSGRIGWNKLGAPAKDLPVWEQAKALLVESRKESAMTQRPVRLELEGAVPRPVRAWRIDDHHSDPHDDPDFMEVFRAQAINAPARAAERTLSELQLDDVPANQLEVVRKALSGASPGEMLTKLNEQRIILGGELHSRVASLMRKHLIAAQNEVPTRLSRHPQAQLAEVGLADTIRRDGRQLVVDLPPWSVLLIEFDFGREQ